ncbi:hypothetical protein B0H17DRAFT_1147788 [Mycena rosella]|uniref:Uncharacterized protein n=1 Tax=Mycena rosella TaxID=1033263 RepID=A0AAD7CHL5_MYCRO|nr:hypothetical protein B0H17DRAFT_1147788 [Mycena rosella]
MKQLHDTGSGRDERARCEGLQTGLARALSQSGSNSSWGRDWSQGTPRPHHAVAGHGGGAICGCAVDPALIYMPHTANVLNLSQMYIKLINFLSIYKGLFYKDVFGILKGFAEQVPWPLPPHFWLVWGCLGFANGARLTSTLAMMMIPEHQPSKSMAQTALDAPFMTKFNKNVIQQRQLTGSVKQNEQVPSKVEDTILDNSALKAFGDCLEIRIQQVKN